MNRCFELNKRGQLFIPHAQLALAVARIAPESFLIAEWQMLRP
jgi:hypothetical protein